MRAPTPDTTKRFVIDRQALAARCAKLGAFTTVEQAKLMGIDKTTLNRWTTGAHVPSTQAVEAVCERLGMSRDVLFPSMSGPRPIRPVAEVAAEIAAGWPKLDAEQREELRRIFAPILRAERTKPSKVPAPRRAA